MFYKKNTFWSCNVNIRFWPAFGVWSTQMLVEIYNMCICQLSVLVVNVFMSGDLTGLCLYITAPGSLIRMPPSVTIFSFISIFFQRLKIWRCINTCNPNCLKDQCPTLAFQLQTALRVFTKTMLAEATEAEQKSFQGQPYQHSCGQRGSWSSLPSTNHRNGHIWKDISQQQDNITQTTATTQT